MSEQTKIDDGGPAFPRAASEGGGRGEYGEQDGMSLRDYFAGKARVADIYGDTYGLPRGAAETLMGSPQPDYATDPIGNLQWWVDAVARFRLMAADAMIAARKQKDSPAT